jgi:hypothetical protein
VKHKLLTLVAIVFVIYFVVTNPTGAAHTASGIGSGLAHVGTAFGTFFTYLTGGGR